MHLSGQTASPANEAGRTRHGLSGEVAREILMQRDQRADVVPGAHSVDGAPLARHHHPVRPMRAAEHESGERIVGRQKSAVRRA